MLRRARVPCAAAPAPAPAVVVAVALLALSAVAAADFFSPLAPIFSPVINSICSTVACGQGNCTVAPGTLGYRCDCRPGWTQLHVGSESISNQGSTAAPGSISQRILLPLLLMVVVSLAVGYVM
ncbi:hypothetical protein ZEAMMB73_Zm00001d027755 [Zea mays]|uniref:EGF-like domain-containing protein n=1 Tax=Zea mays TaxID=4577 RepID=A0A1D6JPD4_MAIZE|nr:hypothetical protein ZEAMMB73_Zm00001d027755 [Zea mays]